MKKESHPNCKRLNELIKLGRKVVDEGGLGFIYESTTLSSVNNTFFKLCDEEISKKTNSKKKFQCTQYNKVGHMPIDAM